MSSIERCAAIAAVAFGLLQPNATQGQGPQNALSCPQVIEVAETASPVTDWQTSGVMGKRKFERVSIYNGKPGGQEFELAPDDEKNLHGKVAQSWHLRGYRSMNIFLRCRYHGTEVTLARDIPARFDTCTLAFDMDKQGDITGKSSFVCH